MFRRITNVKFICDTMLGGLSRSLRKVGIDAIALTSNDNIDHYILVAQRENRYFLTRGNFYVRVMEAIGSNSFECTILNSLHSICSAQNIYHLDIAIALQVIIEISNCRRCSNTLI